MSKTIFKKSDALNALFAYFVFVVSFFLSLSSIIFYELFIKYLDSKVQVAFALIGIFLGVGLFSLVKEEYLKPFWKK